jgi:hypothetical protein
MQINSFLWKMFILCSQIKESEIGRKCVTHGEDKNAYKILVEIPEEKRQLGRTWR